MSTATATAYNFIPERRTSFGVPKRRKAQKVCGFRADSAHNLCIKDNVLIDLGFGTGTLTTKLYKNGCTIYGQDFSSRMIELAYEKMPGAHLYQGDFSKGLADELKQESFDFIIATYSIHHLADAQKVVLLKDLLAHLKDGGKILIGDVAFSNRKALDQCKKEYADEWDDDEIYCVADELRTEFPNLIFEKRTFCSGILILAG